MKRATIKLPDEIDLRLRQEARRRGITISEVTQEAIIEHLGGSKRQLRAAAAGRGGHHDVSERIEEILREEFLREEFA